MSFERQKIINDVREWLEDSQIDISVDSSSSISDTGYEILVLELSGEPVKMLAERYGEWGKLKLRWILPRFEDQSCVIQDFQTGDKYSSGYIFRMPEFDKATRIKLEQEGTTIKPLHLCPNLEKGEVFPAWYRDIELKWKRFAKKATPKCYLENFVRLEAGLNAIFTSSSARQAGKFIKDNSDNENPLLAVENKRQVLIDWPAESLGRLRLPHLSHKNKLCPFETPESKRTGLQLNLAADAELDNDKIKGGDELFSIAVGLIPYPGHTDGPRLMMGGKNMKQAEIGITGAEAPLVPGYYEGNRSRDILSLKNHIKKNKRFFPYLGLNALTVIMPWEGYTYEDGLVISESLAKRFCIKNGHYRYKKTFDVVVAQIDLTNSGIDLELDDNRLDEIFAFNPDKKYVYGDMLPKPSIKFFKKDKPDIEANWNEYYDHHAPGIIERIDVKHVIKNISGSKEKLTKKYNIEFSVSWIFVVERPMGLGDKLTGRNGNKGVVTKILPDEKMPHVQFADGEVIPAELIISPCSILGRKNLGQIWEMTHSLLIKKGGAKLKALLEEKEIDINNIQIDEVKEISDNLSEFLQEAGCDEYGTFKIIAEGKQDIRAFAGWQYFCRLHHHAWKKLQARGVKAPYDFASGQPSRCGARTGQRMGEMENWSLLSHGALSVLLDMRKNQTGNYDKTRNLFSKILRSLGLSLIETSTGIQISVRDHDDDGLPRKNLRYALHQEDDQPAFCAMIKSDLSCKDLAETIRDRLKKKADENEYLNPVIKQLDELINEESFFNEDGTLHIEPDVLNYSAELKADMQEAGSVIPLNNPQLRQLLLRFCMNGNDYDRAKALIAYRHGLTQILSHKTGVPRYYMSGRRYNHSGRAVIVPEPSLELDSVYLPAAMLIEMLECYDDIYTNALPREIKNSRKIFNDLENNKLEAKRLAEMLDGFLNSPLGVLWCFLIRQPSLHRHSVQAFKIRCWEFPVIGMPPFVTPGFNADFDGDTMAVFLPPYQQAQNLSRFSILNNPGLVGNGKSALASSLDLALGWWKISDKTEKLSEHIEKLFKNMPRENLGNELQKLQINVAKNSSGAATLSPLEFEYLLKNSLDDDFSNNISGLNVLINSGAKGSRDDVEKIVKNIGEIEKVEDDDTEKMEKVNISGNFWQGLNEDDLFTYSYPSRYSMAQKKLSVAEAGYLSRLLAEKLYECTISIDDCGTSEGIEISFSHEHNRILIDNTILPTLGNLFDDLERVLWGRVLAGTNKCLSSEDIGKILEDIKNGERIILRSPIHCRETAHGHICKKCYGADVALKPYDKPELVYKDFCAGLTAAQAIGERGTQLAMKRFHDVSSAAKSPIQQVRELLTGKKNHSLSEVITKVLILDDEKTSKEEQKANKELPQSLIHFEVAVSYALDKKLGKYLSDIAGERISDVIHRESDFDDLRSMKSQLIWEGGK